MQNTPFKAQLARLCELMDCIPIHDPGKNNFYDFDLNLAHAEDFFLRRERELQKLNDQSWGRLKEKALPYLSAHDMNRGWQQLFNTLNEARAYNYLKLCGCTNLSFIPKSKEKSPDLEGLLASSRVLCEVKTINISDQEIAFRTSGTKARLFPTHVPAEFLEKMHKTIECAKVQLLAFDSLRKALHFVYLNIVFDDFLAELKESYFKEIDDNLAKTQMGCIRLIICNDHTPFYKPLDMRLASVDNIS